MVRRRWESGLSLDRAPLLEARQGRRLEADARQRLGRAAGRRLNGRGLRLRLARRGRRVRAGRSGRRGPDVGVEHAAARPAAAYRAEVDAQLAGEPAGGGRRGHRAARGRALVHGRRSRRRVGGRCRPGPGRRGGRGGGRAVVGEGDEHRADLHGLPRSHVDLLDPAADGRGDLHLRLVGLHLEQRGVLADDLALAHEHRDDLGLGKAFSQVREGKLARHIWKARRRASRGRPRARGARRGRWRAPGRSPRRARRARSRGGPAPRARGTPPP